MAKQRCAQCNAEINDEEAFIHDGKPYCPECTLEHVRAKHSAWFRTPT